MAAVNNVNNVNNVSISTASSIQQIDEGHQASGSIISISLC